MDAHPIHRRWFAEDLIRLRRADEQRRYLASQRSGRVDPNPHQIDAVIFALQRLPQGGCILADEVGLGKTIEAGLVMAQMRAEGAQRILLVTPKPLLGQWRQELSTLFGIETREGAEDERGFEGPGVFLVGREYAGSEQGVAALAGSGGFDLAVIDEAHEIFAGIYRRYDRHGNMRSGSRYATMAARVKQLLSGTPVLLLTATPIQNTLTELWGLVQYIEPTGMLLGDLPTFRSVFCDGDDRQVRPDRDEELRRRIAEVCQRTLRKQAQEFIKEPFTARRTRLFEYTMSPAEKTLYDDVTGYLLEPNLCAFRGNHRRLLLIGFHRRMASSTRALAASLEAVAARLRRQCKGPDDAPPSMFAEDLEEEGPFEPTDRDEGPVPPPDRLRAELGRVEELAARAHSLPTDSKGRALSDAVRFVLNRSEQGDGSGKVVVFTEALTTQEYLAELLVEHGVVPPEGITLFRGQNTGPRAAQALARWDEEVGRRIPETSRPSRQVAVRMAAVYEFETRSKVFIATEAGAKGLNLQFCENVINYDLPWNPQRIEQRIGRCHRYGQTRDVTVINFLARDNDAQRLTFDILSRKLELFGTVLDASDAVLYEPGHRSPQWLAGALGVAFESQLEQVYLEARNADELKSKLAQVDANMGRGRQEVERRHADTAGLIESRLDETVRTAFRSLAQELPEGLVALDRELEAMLLRYWTAIGAGFVRRAEAEDRAIYRVEPSAALPAPYREGATFLIGRSERATDAEPLHLGHALVRAAVDEARRATAEPFVVRLDPDAALPPPLERRRGQRGRASVLRVQYGGYEPVVELAMVAVFEHTADTIAGVEAQALLLSQVVDIPPLEPPVAVTDDDLVDAEQEVLFVTQAQIDAREQVRFEQAMERIERHMEDRIIVLVRARGELRERLRDARARREAAMGAEARIRVEAECKEISGELENADGEIARLRARNDPDYDNWSQRALQRRFAPPRVERILELEFLLA